MIKTLVVAPNWVGDTVMAWPVLDALAAADRQVHVLGKAHLGPLLSLTPAVSGFVERRDDATTTEYLANRSFDEGVLLPNSFRSAWLLRQAGIARRWGYKGEFRRPLLSPPVARPKQGKRHQIEDYAELLEAMDVAAPASWSPAIELPAEVSSEGSQRLERGGISRERRPVIGLFPGAEFGPSKRWPWRRFAALATELRRRWPNAAVVIVAGPKEVWLAVRVHEESGLVHPVIGPDLDLAGLAGVLAHLDVLITNDSGPMHLAAALGVPTVAFFGPTNPVRTAPSGPAHELLISERWCAPCFRKRCPLLHHGCLRDFTVEMAADRCARLLDPEGLFDSAALTPPE